MPSTLVSLPIPNSDSNVARVHFLTETKRGSFEGPEAALYLRHHRTEGVWGSGWSVASWRQHLQNKYYRELPILTHELTRLCSHFFLSRRNTVQGQENDLIFSPPSRFALAWPFRRALLKAGIARTDITDWFCRCSPVFSGSGASVADLISVLDIHCPHCQSMLSTVERIWIVDDIFWRGVTAASVISMLRNHGLSSQTEIEIVAPLRIHGVTRGSLNT